MHTVELMEQAVAIATELGYGVRQEWLGGVGGGACEIAGRKWIFLDLSLTTSEQLDQLTLALQSDPSAQTMKMPAELQDRVTYRRSA
jgi:hypothetical protein